MTTTRSTLTVAPHEKHILAIHQPHSTSREDLFSTTNASAVIAMATNGSAETMKAVRYYGKKDLRVDDIPIPKIRAGFVKVAPKFCGICGTDLHEYLGGNNLIPTTAHPHPLTGESAPLTLGHEFSAIVEEVGDGVTHVQPGDKVCIQPTIWDGDCRSCKRGLVNCCDKNGFVGLSGYGGGMSEHAVVPGTAIKKLPDSISLQVGALIEPLSVGWHAVASSPYRDGDAALVIGGGPIGLAVVQALLGKGCKNIIVSEVSRRRREFALQFGAHHAINPVESDLVDEVNRLTDGQLADIAYDAAGVQQGVDAAFRAIRARGMLVNIAVWENRVNINMNDIVFRERSYMGVATFALGDFEAVIEAIDKGMIKPEGMITKTIAMDKVVEDGFVSLIEDKDNQVKILVDISAALGK